MAEASQLRRVGDWVLQSVVGQGSFAVVWKATSATSAAAAAVKEIDTEKLNKKLKESLACEIAVLEQTKHQKNIVSLLDIIKDAGKIYLVLEYCSGGDLGQYIRRYGRTTEETAQYFMRQLAAGLKELRAHNLVHRDLKPQNLLLLDASPAPVLKVADFGFARALQPQGLAETLCGSPLYMAPEILQFQKYDAKADLWSVGAILFELLAGRPPFGGANHLQLLQNIERHEAKLPEALAAGLSPACRQLVGLLLRRNPVERISFEEFFSHPFLTGAAASTPVAPAPTPAPLAAGQAALSAPDQRSPQPLPSAAPETKQTAVAAAPQPPQLSQPPTAPEPVAASPMQAAATQSSHPLALPVSVARPTQPPVSPPQHARQQQRQPPSSQLPPLYPAPAPAIAPQPYSLRQDGPSVLSAQQQPAPLHAARAAAAPPPRTTSFASPLEAMTAAVSSIPVAARLFGRAASKKPPLPPAAATPPLLPPASRFEEEDDDNDDFVVISSISSAAAPAPAAAAPRGAALSASTAGGGSAAATAGSKASAGSGSVGGEPWASGATQPTPDVVGPTTSPKQTGPAAEAQAGPSWQAPQLPPPLPPPPPHELRPQDRLQHWRMLCDVLVELAGSARAAGRPSEAAAVQLLCVQLVQRAMQAATAPLAGGGGGMAANKQKQSDPQLSMEDVVASTIPDCSSKGVAEQVVQTAREVLRALSAQQQQQQQQQQGASFYGSAGGGASALAVAADVLLDQATGCGTAVASSSPLSAPPLPPALDVLLQQALLFSKSAAVDELMGNFASSVRLYQRVAHLLLFMRAAAEANLSAAQAAAAAAAPNDGGASDQSVLTSGSRLALQPPHSLEAAEAAAAADHSLQRLRRYYHAVHERYAACVAAVAAAPACC